MVLPPVDARFRRSPRFGSRPVPVAQGTPCVAVALVLALLLMLLSPSSLRPAHAAATFTVTSAGDEPDSGPGNGVCQTAAGTCTLRAAITESNAQPGTDTIRFSIGTGIQTISPSSYLPPITSPVIIDGTTQPGYAGSPLIELNGASAGPTNGLWIMAGSSTLKGLVINRFAAQGIYISQAGNNIIQGSYIGTDVTGTLAAGNGQNGIFVLGSPNNLIGGAVAGSGNVISGNVNYGVVLTGDGATGNRLEGNVIGARKDGAAALANGFDGVHIRDAANNVIGGTAAGAGNIISGNGNGAGSGGGVVITGSRATGNTVQGNFIGTDKSGVRALGNRDDGVRIYEAPGNLIGGTTESSRNVIAGNTLWGVLIEGTAANGNTVQGNYIGVDKSGLTALANGGEGVHLYNGSNNLIGGVGAGNVISGNRLDGMFIGGAVGTGNRVQGNYIGTDVTGTAAIPNGGNGVRFYDSRSHVVGGTAPGAGNVISSNSHHGVLIEALGWTGIKVQGNLIGTNKDSTAALGNGWDGVRLQRASGNRIGGLSVAAGNVIAGSGWSGVFIAESGATRNLVQRNAIGTDKIGSRVLGNSQHGVWIGAGASQNKVNTRNTIAYNGLAGVYVNAGTRNPVRTNAIYGNGGLGINLFGPNDLPTGVTPNDSGDADTGSNALQNYPVLTGIALSGGTRMLQGTLNSMANITFTLEIFYNVDPSSTNEGQVYVGYVKVATNGSGNGSFSYPLPASVPVGAYLTATSTGPALNTSEFSNPPLLVDQ